MVFSQQCSVVGVRKSPSDVTQSEVQLGVRGPVTSLSQLCNEVSVSKRLRYVTQQCSKVGVRAPVTSQYSSGRFRGTQVTALSDHQDSVGGEGGRPAEQSSSHGGPDSGVRNGKQLAGQTTNRPTGADYGACALCCVCCMCCRRASAPKCTVNQGRGCR